MKIPSTSYGIELMDSLWTRLDMALPVAELSPEITIDCLTASLYEATIRLRILELLERDHVTVHGDAWDPEYTNHFIDSEAGSKRYEKYWTCGHGFTPIYPN